jgi:hypothetical protein
MVRQPKKSFIPLPKGNLKTTILKNVRVKPPKKNRKRSNKNAL